VRVEGVTVACAVVPPSFLAGDEENNYRAFEAATSAALVNILATRFPAGGRRGPPLETLRGFAGIIVRVEDRGVGGGQVRLYLAA
jgi:hypothetical protein